MNPKTRGNATLAARPGTSKRTARCAMLMPTRREDVRLEVPIRRTGRRRQRVLVTFASQDGKDRRQSATASPRQMRRNGWRLQSRR